MDELEEANLETMDNEGLSGDVKIDKIKEKKRIANKSLIAKAILKKLSETRAKM